MFQTKINERIRLILVIFILLFLIILVRIVYVQTIEYKKLSLLADDLWSRELPITAERGKILDRNGVILATNKTTSTLIIIPCLLLAKKGFAVNIKSIISLYNSSTFVFAIIRDLVIAIIFTILGISGVINQIKAKGLDEEELKEHSKKQNTLYTILIVIAIVISTVVGSINTSDNKPNTKTKLYETSGIKITLPNDMLVYNTEDYDISYANNSLMFLGIKEPFTILSDIGLDSSSTIEEYAVKVQEANRTPTFIPKDNYMYNTKTENLNNTSYDYVIMVAKGKDSFYILNFISLTKDKMQDKVFSYIDTIEFE